MLVHQDPPLAYSCLGRVGTRAAVIPDVSGLLSPSRDRLVAGALSTPLTPEVTRLDASLVATIPSSMASNCAAAFLSAQLNLRRFDKYETWFDENSTMTLAQAAKASTVSWSI